jgi:hypothetical protein
MAVLPTSRRPPDWESSRRREVECVCLWSPPVHERGDQQGVVVEPWQLLHRGTSARSLSPSTNRATGRSPTTRSLKKIIIYLTQLLL